MMVLKKKLKILENKEPHANSVKRNFVFTSIQFDFRKRDCMYCIYAHKIGSSTTLQIFSRLLQSRTGANEQLRVIPQRHAQWRFTSTQVWDAYTIVSRSRWPRSLRRGSAAARLLGLRVWILPGSWKSVSCKYYGFAVRSLCFRLITRPE
jgi:hypothetical protein